MFLACICTCTRCHCKPFGAVGTTLIWLLKVNSLGAGPPAGQSTAPTSPLCA